MGGSCQGGVWGSPRSKSWHWRASSEGCIGHTQTAWSLCHLGQFWTLSQGWRTCLPRKSTCHGGLDPWWTTCLSDTTKTLIESSFYLGGSKIRYFPGFKHVVHRTLSLSLQRRVAENCDGGSERKHIYLSILSYSIHSRFFPVFFPNAWHSFRKEYRFDILSKRLGYSFTL